MIELGKYFNTPQNTEHPKVKEWILKIEKENLFARIKIDRPRDVIGFETATISIFFYKNDKLISDDSIYWDDDLNYSLITHGIKAESKEDEIQRFSLTLQWCLSKAEEHFGDGYFNAMLMEIVNTEQFIKHTKIFKVASSIRANQPCKSPIEPYLLCKQMIEQGITICAQSLVNNLKYDIKEATDILLNALAEYLDERFFVTQFTE